MKNKVHVIETWGELACFTRPELKVERFSYPVITPSAARGIFDAIYCKPAEFRWQIQKIEILAPPNFIPLRRNEVKDKASVSSIKQWMSGKKQPEPIVADGDQALMGTDMRGRTQRQTMALKGVRYRLHGEIRPWPAFKGHPSALDEQFQRRAKRGQCFMQPYFGCREFPAYFRLLEEPDTEPILPANYSQDVGLMLYDVFDLSRQGKATDQPFISLFRASIKDGVLEVPPFESSQVLKPEGGRNHA